MAEFVYKALDFSGKEVSGNINAESKEEALNKVKLKDMTPLSVEEANAMNKSISLGILQARPKPRDLSVFCRQMVSILSAGVPLARALEMLGLQTENKVLAEAINGCKSKIESGSSMHEAMQDYACMSGIFATMIGAGEESGSLEIAFTRMSEKFEKDAALKALVKKSLMYPIVLIVVLIAVIIVMLTFVIPKFEDFLGSLGSELPALTQAIVNASKFFQQYWYIIAVVVALLVVGFKAFKKNPVGRHIIDNITLKIPLLGPLTTRTACANIMRTMATLLSTGISMMDALDITKETMANIHYYEALDKAKAEVAQGVPLSESFEQSGLFPPMVYHMTAVGEETGNLVEMFDRAAEYYDEEVKSSTEALTAAMEPMVIVSMAGIVGTMVIACLMPMMSMYDSLDSMHICASNIINLFRHF